MAEISDERAIKIAEGLRRYISNPDAAYGVIRTSFGMSSRSINGWYAEPKVNEHLQEITGLGKEELDAAFSRRLALQKERKRKEFNRNTYSGASASITQEYRPLTDEGKKQVAMRLIRGEPVESLCKEYAHRGVGKAYIMQLLHDSDVNMAARHELGLSEDIYDSRQRELIFQLSKAESSNSSS